MDKEKKGNFSTYLLRCSLCGFAKSYPKTKRMQKALDDAWKNHPDACPGGQPMEKINGYRQNVYSTTV